MLSAVRLLQRSGHGRCNAGQKRFGFPRLDRGKRSNGPHPRRVHNGLQSELAAARNGECFLSAVPNEHNVATVCAGDTKAL